MKKTLRIAAFLVALAGLAGCTGGPAFPAGGLSAGGRPETREDAFEPYVLQPGDVLEIKLFYHPELNETVTIRPDGLISLQLIDEVKALGLTPSQLDAAVTEKYAKVVKNPDVSIMLKRSTTQRVFVGGEVRNPGLIPLDAGMTSLRAIFRAGGYLATAEPKGVVVLRNRGTPTPEFIVLDLDAALNGRKPHNDIALRPQDIVFVPKSRISKLNLFIEQYINKLIPIQRTVGLSYTWEEFR